MGVEGTTVVLWGSEAVADSRRLEVRIETDMWISWTMY